MEKVVKAAAAGTTGGVKQVHSFEELFEEKEKKPTRPSWPIMLFTDLSSLQARSAKPQITRKSVVEHYIYLHNKFDPYLMEAISGGSSGDDQTKQQQQQTHRNNALVFEIGKKE